MNWTRIILITAIIILINLLSRQYFIRIDATEDDQYTLSQATQDILEDLTEPVTVTAYFTRDLPQQYMKNYTDFRDLLIEYSARSRGMVNYEFIDPADDPQVEQEAVSAGISPLLINVREKDEVAQKKAFMGALLQSGDQRDVIGYIPPGGAMEYLLTTSIKKITSLEKPAVGIVQDFGCPNMNEIALMTQALSVQYAVEPISLSADGPIDSRIRTVVLIRPTDSIPPPVFRKLDDFNSAGGNLVLAINTVEGDFQSVSGKALQTGIPEWTETLGVRINTNFVTDASAGTITVQQRQGFFTINSALEFPYFPMVTRFEEHPITTGLEQIVFQFISSLEFTGDSSAVFQPLIYSSENSGVLTPPIFFDIEKEWSLSDFNAPPQVLGAILENPGRGRMAVFGDGDFGIGAQGRGQTPDNVSLLVNSVDYLSDDTGLIELRTKGVTSRPIEEMEESQRSTIKWVSFLLPIALIVIYGLYRFNRNRRIRLQRMLQEYS